MNTANTFDGTTINSGDTITLDATYYIRHKSGTGSDGLTIPASDSLAFTGAKPAPAPNPAPVGIVDTVGPLKYQVTSNEGVAVTGVKSKKTRKVTIPDYVAINGKTLAVTSIEYKAFYKCKKMTKVNIGRNITYIGGKAFNKAYRLKTVVIKSTSLNKIGKKAFRSIKKNVTFKVPKANYKPYKKMIKKANAPSRAKYRKL